MVDVEKIKKGLDTCALRSAGDCTCCPYFENTYCNDLLASDAAEYIESLEERIAIKDEALDALEQRCKALGKDPDYIKVTRCKDCEHATMTTDGRFCKYCELVTDDDGCEKQVYYDANWYCGSAERVSE